MGINRKIQKLLDQKKRAEKEIEKLQLKCRHPSRHLKFIYPNPKSQLTDCRWVCEECDRILKIPTNEELEKFLRK